MMSWNEEWSNANSIVASSLPKRGWYMTGQEPSSCIPELATLVQANDWKEIDDILLANLPKFKPDPLTTWLNNMGIPDYCIKRLSKFLCHHEAGNYEEATYLGVPLLDELCYYLFGRKSFTTKRGKGKDQSKPEIAFATPNGPAIQQFCKRFIAQFGSLQEDCQANRLADEDYWNRHAIVHGLMRRSMGLKDAGKCLMALGFLIYACDDKQANRGE